MADLGAIEEDVPFDNAAAEALIRVCDTAASLIEGQAGSRASWVNTASAEFRGRFSQLFRSNASVASADASELVARLREVATGARRLKEEAAKEQQRREVAREWKREQDNRNLWDKGVDAVFGGDDPPVGPPAAEPQIPVSPPVNGTRETPAPGSGGGGGGGGTSSARPADLRAFANGSRGANQTLQSRPSTCRSAYSDFQSRCRWGSLEASGVFTGFDKYLAANEEDVRWATLVADAFAAAGGEGAVSTVSDSALLATLQAAGVDAARQDIVIDPPMAYGNPPTTGYANDPVNTSTGNFLENEVDLGFAGAADSLALTRTYNSFDTSAGAFGPGWSSWAEAGLQLDDEAARMRMPDGRVVVFPRLGTGWDRGTGESLWLARLHEQGFQVRGNDGSWCRFDRDGRLVEQAARPGAAVRAEHRDGRLVALQHERGRSVELTWGTDATGEPRVVAATSSDGRHVDYSYDDAGRLTRASGPGGPRTYTWNEAGLIAAVTDADGVVEVENTYDQHGRVAGQRSPFGRLTRFVYLPGNVTVVSDVDGTRSNTWLHDSRGRLVGVVDAHERRQSTSYDGDGNPVMVTERDGSTTVHEYDDRGRRVRTVTPDGADITFGYDDADRMVTVVAGSGGVTTYSYDGDGRNPATMTDPEGGVTRLTWDDGLLRQVEDPAGVVVTFTHDERGDLVGTTDADGSTARLERDSSGRVRTAVSPLGHRTSYSYSPAGQLSSRTDPDGAVWRYEHTTAGRLSAVIDPTGARTEIERGPHGEEVRSIDPLGREVTRRLDDLGNLAAVVLPDGARWEYHHDALSRLTATVDPAGRTWTTHHDEVGAPTLTVDPTGVRRTVSADRHQRVVSVDDGLVATSTRFDPLGRVVEQQLPDGSASLASYDLCGRPVELVDAEGGLTRIRRDAAGRPVEVVSPSGATTRHEYDRCGRLAATVDPTGARTTREYDADGRLVRQVLPTGDVAWAEHDPCGRITALSRPGRGVARYRYDAAGRVVESSDTWFGRRRFRYDAAGQLVQVVNGNGGVTRYDYDANGCAVAITDPLGHTTRREFDVMNRCVAETDPLGRTTRAGYDGAGRQVWQEDPTGRRTTWRHDASGRVSATIVDGVTTSTIERDVRGRSVSVEDHTAPHGRTVSHHLEYDGRGRLVRCSRDGRSVAWSYDADGRRTSMTTPDGHRTGYTWDAAGRLVALDHPLLGRAVFVRDAAGRLVEATAGDLVQTWDHRAGNVVAHTVGDPEGFARTLIGRDEDGRVTSIERDGVLTHYEHDGAQQLVEARTEGSVTRWHFDAAGRLVGESVDGVTREHSYDAAGQLVATREPSGGTTTHSYDELGRRTRTSTADGVVRDYTWSATGLLSGVTEIGPQGTWHVPVHVDALGEVAEVGGTELFWDRAAPYSPAPVQAGGLPVVPAGVVTGIGDTWTAPGWRSGRAESADPWGGAGLPGHHRGSSDLSLDPSGGLHVAGLELLGARAYDPVSRGFLSVDPLDPVSGAGWAGNPYSYAGNDPLHAVDPTGLRPVTDAELQAYIAANQGALAAAGDWVSDNWEYLAGGAMVVAGGVLIATGVGGPAGMMLVGAGADVIIQKATTGGVNWGQVAVMGAAGGLGGAAAAARWGTTGLRAAVATGAASGAAAGGAGGAYTYGTGPGPHTATGLLQATAQGTVFGGVTGGAGGAAGHGLTSVGGRVLSRITPSVETPYGPALQELSPGALAARHEVTQGAPIYRMGTMGKSQAAEGQFWALEHPSTPGYAARYGMPQENVVNVDFVEQARVPPGAPFVTRSAPAVGDNPGGGIEVVVPPNGAELDWFSTLEPKALG